METPRSAGRPRVLFVPVSGPEGIGEFVRCRMIARALLAAQPGVDVRFVVARDAPYRDTVPFRCFHTEGSPTRHPGEVDRILRDFRPWVVVFDGAGRTRNFVTARRLGARSVWISTYRRRRRKGLRWRRLRALDAHWIVQPEFVDGGLRPWERWKCRLARRPEPVFLGPVLPEPRRPEGLGIPAAGFWLASAGGGGLRRRGVNVSSWFAGLAEAVTRRTGLAGIVVMGPNFTGEPPGSTVNRIVPAVSPEAMVWLRAHARFALIGGGSSSLLQTAALGTPSVAVALNRDQHRRIARFARAGLTVAGGPSDAALVGQCAELPERLPRAALRRRASRLLDRGGLDGIVDALRRLL